MISIKEIQYVVLLSSSLLTTQALAANTPPPQSYNISILDLDTKHLAYNEFTNTLWATVPSSAGYGLGNSLTTFNLSNWEIATSTFIGSEPDAIAISGNGQYVYAGLGGSNAVKRFDTITGATTTISLGSSTYYGPLYAEDIEVMPGSPETIAVSLKRLGVSPRHGGVVVIDGTTARPTKTPDHTGANKIAFSNDPNTLYGYNNETSEFGIRTMKISESGISTASVAQNAFSGYGVDIEFEDGLLYSTNGRVYNPATGIIEGTYNCSVACGVMEADAGSGFVYFMGSGTLSVFDLATFTPFGSYALPGVNGKTLDLISLTDGRLAFNTNAGQVVLLTPVPEPQTYAMFMAGLLTLASLTKRRQRM